MKMRKRLNNASLQVSICCIFELLLLMYKFVNLFQTELIDILKNMFLPSKKMIKEQLEWLIEHKYMKRDDEMI